MSNSKISQVSTKSHSKIHHTQLSPFFKELLTSVNAPSAITDLSVDLNQSSNIQDSFCQKDLNKKDNLGSLEALDISVIPNSSNSISFIKASVLEIDKSKTPIEEPQTKFKPLILETTQIKQKWWCQSCIMTDTKTHNQCLIV
ncbi:hypothetical protein SteCoe_26042 [Stentor coeruleus]|uniref:Uncharacterized protein n=1 Tax=Stentor coeruleus TaxID=5963 RepID=A0A1R2BDZ2_9CILI|nr:hypothetical protein SteCoe_26042 [Stentor coeruleus]